MAVGSGLGVSCGARVAIDHTSRHFEFDRGCVKPLIVTTGLPSAHASHDKSFDKPKKKVDVLDPARALLQRPVVTK
ncbi:hypothetical protein [Paraburkholderia sp. J41]|uniref:hypothetical protein n=1 Tax=Paraburkholderia sp. J41 TaxID=2805433 RepID=UPI002AC3727C|nr:hypothetical protein [Paraburkholderia sp. J41]